MKLPDDLQTVFEATPEPSEEAVRRSRERFMEAAFATEEKPSPPWAMWGAVAAITVLLAAFALMAAGLTTNGASGEDLGLFYKYESDTLPPPDLGEGFHVIASMENLRETVPYSFAIYQGEAYSPRELAYHSELQTVLIDYSDVIMTTQPAEIFADDPLRPWVGASATIDAVSWEGTQAAYVVGYWDPPHTVDGSLEWVNRQQRQLRWAEAGVIYTLQTSTLTRSQMIAFAQQVRAAEAAMPTPALPVSEGVLFQQHTEPTLDLLIPEESEQKTYETLGALYEAVPFEFKTGPNRPTVRVYVPQRQFIRLIYGDDTSASGLVLTIQPIEAFTAEFYRYLVGPQHPVETVDLGEVSAQYVQGGMWELAFGEPEPVTGEVSTLEWDADLSPQHQQLRWQEGTLIYTLHASGGGVSLSALREFALGVIASSP
jgi:hypothetical protein